MSYKEIFLYPMTNQDSSIRPRNQPPIRPRNQPLTKNNFLKIAT